MKEQPKKWIKHKKYEPIRYGVMGYSYEWLCEHGIGHENGIHGCDGCCSDKSYPGNQNETYKDSKKKD